MLQARSRRRMPMVMPTTVHIRRSYAESRHGQLHMITAYPSGGGFDERVPLLCLHPAGSTSAYFSALLPELGHDRSVYAFDMPGHGHSDKPAGEWSITDAAVVIGEFADNLRLRNFDVFGVQLGALVATELATRKPDQVRRMVLASVPHFTAEEAKSAEWTALFALPVTDGSHLLKEWQHLQATRSPMVSPEQLTEELADVLHGHARSTQTHRAMLDYPIASRLNGLCQSGLILRPRDEFYEHCQRARNSYPQSQLEELPDTGSNIFASQPQRVLQLVRQFLDR